MDDKAFLKQMGNRIFLRRKALRLTQEELAERIDVSTQMISNLETGKKAIRPENLSKICKALDVSADYIMTGTERYVSVDPIYQKLSNFSDREMRLITELIEYMNDKGGD